MGFERIGKQFTLQFEQEHYAGLEVVMGSLSTDQFLEVTELSTTVQAGDLGKAAGEFRKLVEIAASRLRRWNLEDMGEAIPATRDGLGDQEFEFVMDVVVAWLNAIAAVAPPLPVPLNSGGRSPELSIPMEPLSPSPGS
jgi:hypothetical protein